MRKNYLTASIAGLSNRIDVRAEVVGGSKKREKSEVPSLFFNLISYFSVSCRVSFPTAVLSRNKKRNPLRQFKRQ